jgi:NAD(P)H-dependent FMN reductase
MLKIALIIGSTRPQRFADNVGKRVLDAAGARADLGVEVLDLREQQLPLFEEPVPKPDRWPLFVPGRRSMAAKD